MYLNGIDYEYEPRYKYNIPGVLKPYTPDFIIRQNGQEAYIEHFGITENKENNRFSKDELERYLKAIHDKIEIHKQHDTKLICTCSQYNDGRELTEHLADKLREMGFILIPKDNKEILRKINEQDGCRYVRKLINLIDRFISNFKTFGFTENEFDKWQTESNNVRTKLFLRICKECYLEYQKYLNENNSIDFSDMINRSARLLENCDFVKEQIKFKYIIVDEYQDISRQRFNLVKAIHDNSNAKVIAVGDDWQSIYAFSGSDISLFTKFREFMGYAELLAITKTYRNAQEVIDIAGNFIQKNSSQIKKTLQSPKNIKDPVIIYTYDGSFKQRGGSSQSGSNYNLAKAVETAIEQIIEFDKNSNKQNSTILLLGRFNFDGKNLERSGLFEYNNDGSKVKCLKHPNIQISFMTAHASKGLGYDNVIVINGKNETYGFPSKIEDDPVLNYVMKHDNSIPAAEERRLFYVAMTRTKNRVFFIAPEQNPSEFLLEIKKDYKNVILKGTWNPDSNDKLIKRSCPICGYPLQHKYKIAYGLNLWICTNEPEICDFMTTRLEADKLSILKCPDCDDGFLIPKPSNNNTFFLGCTNYLPNKKGCNKTIGKDEYYGMMNYTDGTSFKQTNIRNEKQNSEKEDSSNIAFCINCGDKISFQLNKPLCKKCFVLTTNVLDSSFNYCNLCGTQTTNIRFNYPVCEQCKKKLSNPTKLYPFCYQ